MVKRLEVHWRQSGLPVVAVDHMRSHRQPASQLTDRSREEDETFAVVRIVLVILVLEQAGSTVVAFVVHEIHWHVGAGQGRSIDRGLPFVIAYRHAESDARTRRLWAVHSRFMVVRHHRGHLMAERSRGFRQSA